MWFIGAAAVVVLITTTVLLSLVDDAISTAIQATSTLVLVAITGVYAYSTYRLVRAQELGPTRETQVKAVAEVMTLAHRDGALGVQIGGHVANDLLVDGVPSHEEYHHLRDLFDHLDHLEKELSARVLLLPDPVYDPCWNAIMELIELYQIGDALLDCVSEVIEEADAFGSPYQLQNVRARYLAEYREDLVSRPEWEELASGARFQRGFEVVDDLINAARAYIEESR